MALPPVQTVIYNRIKLGYFGELGNGAYARIRFLQSAVTKDELDNITLIEHIPGSERWAIQDLFQRDVDMARVEESILPYFKDPTKVKFFNPLTLVLLPVGQGGGVDAEVPYVSPLTVPKGEHEYTRYERQGLFYFDVHNKTPAYSELNWNDAKVKLVAIDGQHRLSALKFWKDNPGAKDLDNWQIPVVILGVFRADDNPAHSPANLLEIVRKTFVYINSRAEEVNEARRILLDDEEMQAVCTQEVVQASHANDCLPGSQVDLGKMPLLFFDWRGQVKWRKDEAVGSEVSAPGSVLSIVELYDWLRYYILGDDPETVLELEDLDPPLSENFRNRNVLSHEDTGRIRAQFLKLIYPGLSYLFEKFDPFQAYIGKIRKFEINKRLESDSAGYAFQRLRFGSHPQLLKQMKDLVDSAYGEILETLKTMRQDCFDELIERDIGMRAIVYAFSALKETRDTFEKKTCSWKDHAEWFVPKINVVYKSGWFRKYSDLKKEQSECLLHICYDPAGSIVNYKISDIPRALGALIALLVAREGLSGFTSEQRAELWDTYGDALDGALRRGFRKEQRARHRNSFTGKQAAFIAKVNEEADKDVVSRLKIIQSKILNVTD